MIAWAHLFCSARLGRICGWLWQVEGGLGYRERDVGRLGMGDIVDGRMANQTGKGGQLQCCGQAVGVDGSWMDGWRSKWRGEAATMLVTPSLIPTWTCIR